MILQSSDYLQICNIVYAYHVYFCSYSSFEYSYELGPRASVSLNNSERSSTKFWGICQGFVVPERLRNMDIMYAGKVMCILFMTNKIIVLLFFIPTLIIFKH